MSSILSHCPQWGVWKGTLCPSEASVEGNNEQVYLVIWNVEGDSILLREFKIMLRSKYDIK